MILPSVRLYMSLLVRIHKKEGRTIVAVCDSDLLGKVFEEGNKQLDLRGEFYNGIVMDRVTLGDMVRNADAVNLVGKDSVQVGLDEGVIEKDQVFMVKGIPHAQALLMQ